MPPHGNIYYDNDKKIGLSHLEDNEYPYEDQKEIPDTSGHVDEKDGEEISVVQEDRGDNLCPIFNLNVESSTPRSKLMGSFTLKHPLRNNVLRNT